MDSIYGFLSDCAVSTQVGESRGNYRDRDAGGRGGTQRGSTGGPQGGGIETSRYTYGVFSNTSYDFISISNWVPDP